MTNGEGITEEALTGLGFERVVSRDALGNPVLVNRIELRTYFSGDSVRTSTTTLSVFGL